MSKGEQEDWGGDEPDLSVQGSAWRSSVGSEHAPPLRNPAAPARPAPFGAPLRGFSPSRRSLRPLKAPAYTHFYASLAGTTAAWISIGHSHSSQALRTCSVGRYTQLVARRTQFTKIQRSLNHTPRSSLSALPPSLPSGLLHCQSSADPLSLPLASTVPATRSPPAPVPPLAPAPSPTPIDFLIVSHDVPLIPLAPAAVESLFGVEYQTDDAVLLALVVPIGWGRSRVIPGMKAGGVRVPWKEVAPGVGGPGQGRAI